MDGKVGSLLSVFSAISLTGVMRSLTVGGKGPHTKATESPRCMKVDIMENNERKQNLYFPEEMLEEMVAEAARQGCSLSTIVQRAWRTAWSLLITVS